MNDITKAINDIDVEAMRFKHYFELLHSLLFDLDCKKQDAEVTPDLIGQLDVLIAFGGLQCKKLLEHIDIAWQIASTLRMSAV
jgi:hypothetical protein